MENYEVLLSLVLNTDIQSTQFFNKYCNILKLRKQIISQMSYLGFDEIIIMVDISTYVGVYIWIPL